MGRGVLDSSVHPCMSGTLDEPGGLTLPPFPSLLVVNQPAASSAAPLAPPSCDDGNGDTPKPKKNRCFMCRKRVGLTGERGGGFWWCQKACSLLALTVGGVSVFRVRLSLWKPVLWHPPILRQAQLSLRLQSRRRRQDPEGEPGGGGGQDPENIDQVATARKRGTRNTSGTLLT